jgi:hypothetical protein
MMAIACGQTGDRWFDFYERRGTTVPDVYDLILRILQDIGLGTPLRR